MPASISARSFYVVNDSGGGTMALVTLADRSRKSRGRRWLVWFDDGEIDVWKDRLLPGGDHPNWKPSYAGRLIPPPLIRWALIRAAIGNYQE